MTQPFDPNAGAIVSAGDIQEQPHQESIRHLLIGSPLAVRQTILRLQTLHYCNATDWSKLLPIPDDRLLISIKPREVMSILVRQIWLE